MHESMRDRIVAVALGLVIACFLFEVVWRFLDDDAPTLIQTAYFSGGLLVATICALIYWSGPA